MPELIYDRETVTEALIGPQPPVFNLQLDGVACLVEGRVVAAVGFENYTGSNVDVHLLVRHPAPVWVRAALNYVETLGVRRITAPIHENNTAARRLFERFGAEVECVCRDWFEDGDLVRYVLWTDNEVFQDLLRRLSFQPNHLTSLH